MLQRRPLKLVESEVHLSDKTMKSMIPMFVRGEAGDSHNCGGCSMFITGGQCTVVEGGISGPKGSCNYWAAGKPAQESDKPPRRMTKTEAGYVEPTSKINCSTCRFVDGTRCLLWQGAVSAGDCCMAWSK